ncbi:MAG: hypothetical protein XD81_1809, partial [Bacteroidetes bacterium 38_7]
KSALKHKINFIFEVGKLSIGKNIKIPDYRQLILYVDFQYVNDRCSCRLLAQPLENPLFDNTVRENYRCYFALSQ